MSPSRSSLLVWTCGTIVVWSCTSNSGSGPEGGSAGASAGNGGALAGMAGNATDLGGAGGTPAGGSPSAGLPGVGGGTAEGGAAGAELGGDSAGGSAGDSNASAGEGGAAGGDSLADFDGRCGEGWAAPGSSPPNLQGSVTPQVDNAGNWSFTFGRYRFVVAAAHGARVIEFSLDGLNLLDPTGGSTFWPSPQQAWNWPPAAEIDTAAYSAQADGTSLSLTSEIAPTLSLSVQKRFWVNASSGVVSLEYQLTNESTQSASWAPWEITRVRAGGYTFAPKGPGNRTIMQDFSLLPLSLLPPPPAANGIEWLNYPSISASLTKSDYINEFDGAEGWLAHANKLGKNSLPVLFVKSFVDAPDASLPTNQAEIQLWTSGTANPKLIEVEQQGAQQALLPGASLVWTVHWSACQLPSAVLLAAGNAELAGFARAHAIKP